MPVANSLPIGCNVTVSYTGAQDAVTLAYLNTGTATWAVKDADDATVGSGSLTYLAASDGNYYGTIPASLTAGLTLDDPYTVVVNFSQTGSTTYTDERFDTIFASLRR